MSDSQETERFIPASRYAPARTASEILVETLAATSMRLVEIARDADFSPPPWPGGLDRIVELKLSETREVTLRLGGERDHDGC